ncbi:MAG: dimethyl sulfoxide reductase anchor subunit [Chthoniobacteraceae bacterium]
MELTAATSNVRTLIDDLLEEQRSLTAVERFSRRHEAGLLDPEPAQARYYRDLIPLSKPGAGEQFAFAVNLDACTGCKACVSACHSLNGLDEDEIWRTVGVVYGGDWEEPFQQTVTTACHHCVDPGCLNGCPVRAYEKDAETGIVRHLDDQCIGCQYCVLKCPYDVPKYSKKRGIVRKCDMCYGRLGAGEAPACVQACPTQAISIRIVKKEEVVATAQADSRLVPGAFDSSYTKPTTAYTYPNSHREMPENTRSADAMDLHLQHAHEPLIGMLLLTQLAAGLCVVAAGLPLVSPPVFAVAVPWLALASFTALQLGLGVSVFHLGRPFGAWRAFLGLGTSWMSREIVVFGAFAGVQATFTVCACWPLLTPLLPILNHLPLPLSPVALTLPMALAAAVTGLAGVFVQQ